MKTPNVAFLLEPEVPGAWADDIVVSTASHPPVVEELSILIDGWLGDDIMEIFPSFIVSERLAKGLCDASLTGFECREMRYSLSSAYHETNSGLTFPPITWLCLHQRVDSPDIYLAQDNRLALSERAMEVLRGFRYTHCDVEEDFV